MELKHSIINAVAENFRVLIVPLWNWNRLPPRDSLGHRCSNRTFMELKQANQKSSERTKDCSNRTFMELKLVPADTAVFLQQVLIVPLWNWNEGNSLGWWSLRFVLIVPLWNWNVIRPAIKEITAGSNRTFMELKLRYSHVVVVAVLVVLIVPLWNWNGVECSGLSRGVCSNRTFMELKQRIQTRKS